MTQYHISAAIKIAMLHYSSMRYRFIRHSPRYLACKTYHQRKITIGLNTCLHHKKNYRYKKCIHDVTSHFFITLCNVPLNFYYSSKQMFWFLTFSKPDTSTSSKSPKKKLTSISNITKKIHLLSLSDHLHAISFSILTRIYFIEY
jgi:hypothetical protein